MSVAGTNQSGNSSGSAKTSVEQHDEPTLALSPKSAGKTATAPTACRYSCSTDLYYDIHTALLPIHPLRPLLRQGAIGTCGVQRESRSASVETPRACTDHVLLFGQDSGMPADSRSSPDAARPCGCPSVAEPWHIPRLTYVTLSRKTSLNFHYGCF